MGALLPVADPVGPHRRVMEQGRALRGRVPRGKPFEGTLLLDSRVLRDQELNERGQQRFASLADVVHELEESQIDREFLLGNTPMRA